VRSPRRRSISASISEDCHVHSEPSPARHNEGGDIYSISKLKQAWKTNTGGVKFDLPAAMCRASSEALFLSKVPKDISEQTKTKYLKYWADGARSAAFLRSSVARQDFQ
jgi:hypothetical protein